MTLQRPRTLTLKFTPKLRALFPKSVQDLKGTKFNHAVSVMIRDLMNNLGGLIKAMSVANDTVKIVWEQSLTDQAPLNSIVGILNGGRYGEAILLMELLLSDEPDQVDYLYNLGMTYSDLGELQQAISLLKRLMELEPKHINGRVALGVALTRDNQIEQAIQELQRAIFQDPTNPWANRNLGAALAKQDKYTESLPYFKRATELNPEDQASWFGLGQTLELTSDMDGADEAYRKVQDIDEFSKIAELARTARSKIAEKSFRSVTPKMERMDAVMYCLGAIERFEKMSLAEVQKAGFEIALLGTRGININDPSTRYTLRSLPGDFSGLQLLCLEYVAFKKFAQDQDIGFDLSAEYRSALSLYEVKNKKDK